MVFVFSWMFLVLYYETLEPLLNILFILVGIPLAWGIAQEADVYMCLVACSASKHGMFALPLCRWVGCKDIPP